MTEDSEPKSGATPELTQNLPAWQAGSDHDLVESSDGEDPVTSEAAPKTPRSSGDEEGSRATLNAPPTDSSDVTVATGPLAPSQVSVAVSAPADATVIGSEEIPKKPGTAKWTGENLTGKKLGGDFVLEKMVGRGGMGEVYRAKQASLDRTVAVKCLPRMLANQPGFIDRFQREAKSAANIVHPNVIQIYAFGVEEGIPYFAMEYVEGEDLQQRLRRLGKLEVDEAVGKTLSVASALQAAHERGVIHRDVKPSNVMLDRNDNVRVMDFGLAKATQGGTELTQSGMIMGTPNYLSPEQGRGDALDGRSDLYSLGVMFFELLVGRVPFTADTPAGLIFKHIYEAPPKPRDKNPDVPPFVEEITLKLLAKDPEERYKDAKALVADLREFLDNREHYYAGNPRREGAGLPSRRTSVAQMPAANTSSTILPKGGDPNRTAGVVAAPMSESGARVARNAVTEEVARDRLPPAPVPAPPVAPPPASSPLVPVLVILLLAGGVFAAWKTGKLDSLLNPATNTNGGGGGIPVVVTNGKSLVLELTAADIGFPGISESKIHTSNGQIQLTLKPGEPQRIPEGDYELYVVRKGYVPINQHVHLADGGDGHARLYDAITMQAFSFVTAYKPVAELQGGYAKGEEALNATPPDLATAQDSFRRAADLDPEYRPAPEKPTAAEMLAQVKGKLGQANAGMSDATDLQNKHQWRALKAKAEANRSDAQWKPFLDAANNGIELGNQFATTVHEATLRGDVSAAQAALSKLEDRDPENERHGELKSLLDQVSAARQPALVAADAATTPEEVASAQTQLANYLKLAPNDTAAKEKRDLIGKRPSRNYVNELNDLIKAHDWDKARALLADPKADPKVKELAQSVAVGRATDMATTGLTGFDSHAADLEKPGALDEFLDARSPELQKDLQAFRDLEAAGAKIVSSKHKIESVTVDPKSADTAEVVTKWDLEIDIEGERQHLALRQTLSMKATGNTWKITRATATKAP